MSEGEALPQPEEDELLTAGQALVVVFLILGSALFYAFKFYRKMAADRKEASFMEYDFELPAEEKQEFEKLLANKPEGQPGSTPAWQKWRVELCKILFQ